MDLRGFARQLRQDALNLLPILVIIGLFQWLAIDEPTSALAERIGGILCVLFGLTFLVSGLERSIFPIGESLADILAQRGSTVLLLVFAFTLGFGSTFAEPALAAVADQAANAAAASGYIASEPEATQRYSLLLRLACSVAVGWGVAVGVLRILLGLPAIWVVVAGYVVASLLAAVGGSGMTGIAMDAGAAATSVINVPLISALGIGLASVLRGRTALADGFGIVALASLMPMLVILTASLLIRPGGP